MTGLQDFLHDFGLFLELRSLFPEWRQIFDHMLDHDLLALETTDSRGTAAVDAKFAAFRGAVDLVELTGRALLRLSGIAALDPRSIGHHAAKLFVDFFRKVREKHRIAVTLAPFAPIQA